VCSLPKHHGELWAASSDRQLRDLSRSNAPTRIIGITLGRTEDAVHRQASDLGVPQGVPAVDAVDQDRRSAACP